MIFDFVLSYWQLLSGILTIVISKCVLENFFKNIPKFSSELRHNLQIFWRNILININFSYICFYPS